MVDCFNCKAGNSNGYQQGWISITYSNKVQEHLKFLDQQYRDNSHYNREQARNYCGYCGPYFQELEIKRLGAISIKNNNEVKINELIGKVSSLETKLTQINNSIIQTNNSLSKLTTLVEKDAGKSEQIKKEIISLKEEFVKLEKTKEKSIEVNENLQNLIKASRDYWTSFDQYQEIRK